MEHKIGKKITLENGKEVVAVEGDECGMCALKEYDCARYVCIGKSRSDHKDIIYKEIK